MVHVHWTGTLFLERECVTCFPVYDQFTCQRQCNITTRITSLLLPLHPAYHIHLICLIISHLSSCRILLPSNTQHQWIINPYTALEDQISLHLPHVNTHFITTPYATAQHRWQLIGWHTLRSYAYSFRRSSVARFRIITNALHFHRVVTFGFSSPK